jgi:hypothetical protein
MIFALERYELGVQNRGRNQPTLLERHETIVATMKNNGRRFHFLAADQRLLFRHKHFSPWLPPRRKSPPASNRRRRTLDRHLCWVRESRRSPSTKTYRLNCEHNLAGRSRLKDLLVCARGLGEWQYLANNGPQSAVFEACKEPGVDVCFFGRGDGPERECAN